MDLFCSAGFTGLNYLDYYNLGIRLDFNILDDPRTNVPAFPPLLVRWLNGVVPSLDPIARSDDLIWRQLRLVTLAANHGTVHWLEHCFIVFTTQSAIDTLGRLHMQLTWSCEVNHAQTRNVLLILGRQDDAMDA